MYRRLLNAQALRKSREDLIEAIGELEKQLEKFKSSFEHIIAWDEPVELTSFIQSSILSPGQIMIIYFLYYGLLLDMHSPLIVPWIPHRSGTTLLSFHDHIEHSCAVVASVARRAILASRLVQLNANCTVLYDPDLAVSVCSNADIHNRSGFFVPFRAVLFLFLHILKEPMLDTVHSDIMLLDVAASHASRLELATDLKLSFDLMKCLGKYALSGVEQAKAKANRREDLDCTQFPRSSSCLNFSAEEETPALRAESAVGKDMNYLEVCQFHQSTPQRRSLNGLLLLTLALICFSTN